MNSNTNFLLNTFVCIIMDDSGSMGEPAANSEEARGYTRNDFSLQGAKLCVNGAPDGLYMGVIKFNSYASVVHNPTKLSSTNRFSLLDSIGKIRPNGGTQIFSAIQEAKRMIDQVREVYGITRSHIILFTDGEDGTLTEANVQSYLSRFAVNGEYPFTMDTVGFGPNANTQLLVQMASLCGGTYALCYDASMVGTIFGRAIARTYLGSQAYGIYESDGPKGPEYYQFKDDYFRFKTELSQLLLAQYRMLSERVDAVDALNSKLEQWLRSARQTIQTNPDWYGFICGLHSDLNGQIRLAVSNPNYWTMWGKAYWQMMGIALTKEYAPNFKDACLQIFGSEQAKKEYARISEIYDEMPMPPPSNQYEAARRIAPIAVTSAAFNNANSGCFHPNSTVVLSSGEHVGFNHIEQMIKSGEQVLLQSFNLSNPIVKLEVLVKTDTSSGPTQFCKIDSCVLTPTHPLSINGEWTHPKTLTEIYEEQVPYVYNVILKDPNTGLRAQSLLVDNKECVGLAHGINESISAVAYDTFWGSEEIVQVIKKLYPVGYALGLVEFNHKFKRNELTGWVDSIQPEA